MKNINKKNSKETCIESNISKIISLNKNNTKIYLKREIFKYFFNYSNIEMYKKIYVDEMEKILYGKITIREQLDKMKLWLDDFNFENLEYLTKLFFVINSINNCEKKNNNESHFINLKAKLDSNFYSLFLEKKNDKNKSKLYYRTKDKNNLLNWLIKLSKPIDLLIRNNNKFEFIPNGYQFLLVKIDSEKNGKKTINLNINSEILNSNYIDFISLDKEIFQEIKLNIEKIKKWQDYNKINKYISVKNYFDCIIRFYYILKLSYNRKRNIKTKSGFFWNKFLLKESEINIRLGDVKKKISNDIIKRNFAKKENSKIEKICYDFIFGMIFFTAQNLKWLNIQPQDPINGVYTFNLNRKHFDSKKTLEDIGSMS